MLILILSIIIGTAIGVLGILFAISVEKDEKNGKGIAAGAIIIIVAMLITMFGITLAQEIKPKETEYTETKVISEIELVSLSNTIASEGGGNLYYISINAENVYSYRCEVDAKAPVGKDKAYEVFTISEDEDVFIQEVEITDGSKPRLVKYESVAKANWLHLKNTKEVYVFFVPEGSITRTITLS